MSFNWRSENVANQVSGVGGYATTIAVDASGNIHVAYWDYIAGKLNYTVKSGGVWSNPITIDTINPAGTTRGYFYVSMALDSVGNPHISYFNWLNGDLKHAWKTGNNWTTEIVEAGVGKAYAYTAIVVDPSGNTHILYTDGAPPTLKYVVKSGNSWSTPENADPNLNTGYFLSLAIDNNGNLHASYQHYVSPSSKELNYVLKPQNGAWQAPQIVDSGSDLGEWTSITSDSTGNIHISYRDLANQCLKYAMKPYGAAWQTPVALLSGGNFEMTSITADAAGNIDVSFYNDMNGTLEFIGKSGGTWGTPQIVDSTFDSGAYCHLALDSKGNRHISYFRTVGATSMSNGITYLMHAFAIPQFIFRPLCTVMGPNNKKFLCLKGGPNDRIGLYGCQKGPTFELQFKEQTVDPKKILILNMDEIPKNMRASLENMLKKMAKEK